MIGIGCVTVEGHQMNRPTGGSHVSFTLGTLSAVGGLAGFLKTGSLPSLFAGVGIGGMYIYGGYLIDVRAFSSEYLTDVLLLNCAYTIDCVVNLMKQCFTSKDVLRFALRSKARLVWDTKLVSEHLCCSLERWSRGIFGLENYGQLE